MRTRASAMALFCALLLGPVDAYGAALPDWKVGVYYFPGWRDGQHKVGGAYSEPWSKIRPFPERRPLLGWYKEGDQSVMDRQIGWMRASNLSFVIFSMMFWPDGHPQLDHATEAFLKSDKKGSFQFGVQWANHARVPRTAAEFDATIRYCIEHYFARPDYLRIDGKPVLFIFSAAQLSDNMSKYGEPTSSGFARAQVLAQAAGLPGIAFVAGGALTPGDVASATTQGYAGLSAYNYRNGAARPFSHSYEDLDAGYRLNWSHLASANPSGFYVVPMTAGWDRRPWGGSSDPQHDLSFSTPEQFEAHLGAARMFMEKNPTLTRGLGVICCWNEFGEGSYIEPTKKWRFAYLAKVTRAFPHAKRACVGAELKTISRTRAGPRRRCRE